MADEPERSPREGEDRSPRRPARYGNPGDVAAVGGGISELRVDYGPGYRIYYVRRGSSFVLLCGGDKATQSRDIRTAKRLAGEL